MTSDGEREQAVRAQAIPRRPSLGTNQHNQSMNCSARLPPCTSSHSDQLPACPPAAVRLVHRVCPPHYLGIASRFFSTDLSIYLPAARISPRTEVTTSLTASLHLTDFSTPSPPPPPSPPVCCSGTRARAALAAAEGGWHHRWRGRSGCAPRRPAERHCE